MGKLFKHKEDVAFASAFRLVRLIFFIAYNMHWAACVWNGVLGEHLADKLELQPGLFERYTLCIWCACSFLLGLGALNPYTVGETYVATIFSVYGACLQACVFGAVAVLIAGLDAEETQFQRKIMVIAQRVRNMHLPEDLRKRVLSYYSMLWNLNRAGSANIDAFVSELSPSLQIDIRLCLFRDMFTKVSCRRSVKRLCPMQLHLCVCILCRSLSLRTQISATSLSKRLS
jgi:hypothetical protein